MKKTLVFATILAFISIARATNEISYSSCKRQFNDQASSMEVLNCFISVFESSKDVVIKIDSARYITSICGRDNKNKRCSFKQSIDVFNMIKEDTKVPLYYEAKYYAALAYYNLGVRERKTAHLDQALQYVDDVEKHKDQLIDTTSLLMNLTRANIYIAKADVQDNYNYYLDAIHYLENAEKDANQKYKIAIERMMFNAKKGYADQVVKKCDEKNDDLACEKCEIVRTIYKELIDKKKYLNVSAALKADIKLGYHKAKCVKKTPNQPKL